MIDDARMNNFPWERLNETATMLTLPVFRRAPQLLCSAVVMCASVACVKQLPAAAIPAPVAPQLADAPSPPPGQGRLVVDVVEGHAPVQTVRMVARENQTGTRKSYRFIEVPEVFCQAAPCARDIPVGNVLLAFPVVGKDATEVELVHVGPDPSVYRRSLSIYEDNTGGLRVFGIISTSVGGAALITGTALLPIGLAKDIDGMTLAGSISLGAGAALLAFGIWAIRHDAPTFRPGSSNHFPLAPARP